MFEIIIKDLDEKYNVTEPVLSNYQLAWVGKTNTINLYTEKIVFKKILYIRNSLSV